MSTGVGSSIYLNLPIQDVDAFVDAAVAAGATEVPAPEPNPAQEMIDAGMMYSRAITDPDGHQWEIVWMSEQMPSG